MLVGASASVTPCTSLALNDGRLTDAADLSHFLGLHRHRNNDSSSDMEVSAHKAQMFHRLTGVCNGSGTVLELAFNGCNGLSTWRVPADRCSMDA